MFKKFVALAALATTVGTAQAATFVFAPGTGGPAAGETLLTDFNDSANDGLVGGNGFQFLTDSSGNGALPGAGDGTRYLSVLGSGQATIDFGTSSTGFSIDIGSVDDYNSLTLFFADGTNQLFTGADLVAIPDGNQQLDRSNGRFTFTGESGQLITGISLASGQNSFEVDNIAISAVPEPTTWAMMLAGFGMVGFGLRSRRRGLATVTA
jgi:hypothetical protein